MTSAILDGVGPSTPPDLLRAIRDGGDGVPVRRAHASPGAVTGIVQKFAKSHAENQTR